MKDQPDPPRDRVLEEANCAAHRVARAVLCLRDVYAELPDSVDDLNPALIARDRALDEYEQTIRNVASGAGE